MQFNGYVIPPVPAHLLRIEQHRPARRFDFFTHQQSLERRLFGNSRLLGGQRLALAAPLTASR